MRIVRHVRALALGAMLIGLMAPLAGAQSFTIADDGRIGSWDLRRHGTLGGAVAAFGGSSRAMKTSDTTCLASWGGLGLGVYLHSVGGSDPCSRRFGLVVRVVTHGSGKWHTTKGLSIGDPVTRLRALYRNALFRPGIRGAWPSGWWLVPRGNGRIGVGGSYPGLLAETLAGRVFAFHVRDRKPPE